MIFFRVLILVGVFLCELRFVLYDGGVTDAWLFAESLFALFYDMSDCGDGLVRGGEELLYPFPAVDGSEAWSLASWDCLVVDLIGRVPFHL